MLDAFLDAQSRQPFRLGRGKDCILQPADWVVLNGWPDPAFGLRGRYSTDLGWQRLVRRAGGLEAVVGAGMSHAGLRSTVEPRRGDVGLVRLPDGRLVGAICTGRMWSVASEAGQLAFRANPVCAWGIDV